RKVSLGICSCELSRLLLRLLQPVRHPHLAVHRRRGGEILLRLLARTRAPVELAEAEVAVGDERAHVQLGSQCEGSLIPPTRATYVKRYLGSTSRRGRWSRSSGS